MKFAWMMTNYDHALCVSIDLRPVRPYRHGVRVLKTRRFKSIRPTVGRIARLRTILKRATRRLTKRKLRRHTCRRIQSNR